MLVIIGRKRPGRVIDMAEKRPNSGTLGRNDRKVQDNHPDHTGSLNVVCPCCGESVDFWLSAWIKRGPTGKFFSLAIKPKEKRNRNDDNDDAPF